MLALIATPCATNHTLIAEAQGKGMRLHRTNIVSTIPADSSRQNFRDHISRDIRQATVPSVEAVRQLRMLKPQQVQQRRVQIIDVSLNS